MSCVTLKFQGWPWTGHVFYDTSSFVHNFIAMCEVITGVSVQKSANLVKISFELFDLAFWPLTLTFCMDITFVNDNYFWKFHDDTMIQTAKKLWRTDGRMDRTIHRAAWSQLKKQGQSEGFDSCARPSNINQVGFKSTVFWPRMIFKFDGWPQKTIGHLFYATSSFVHHFIAISEFKLVLQSRNAQFESKLVICLSRVTLKFDGWPWKTIEHLSSATSSFVHHFIAICVFKQELWSGNG